MVNPLTDLLIPVSWLERQKLLSPRRWRWTAILCTTMICVTALICCRWLKSEPEPVYRYEYQVITVGERRFPVHFVLDRLTGEYRPAKQSADSN